ncbi:uncharacterized protein LOC133189161 [Saccostrea echinata]|uniref:uncharacterized protein LOC133175574 n=1 Tax=Saccostrea echinata TaxID=191078 RepID=UPI002A83E1D2|nr:uncharacterized protein LOC133175574 [Saccostrea echinata]XP_061180554.1 uncharacterized protein LOC133189161 [Saccostrea echinata]
MFLTAQMESERKLRKDTEERCRQLMLKIEHMQAILNLRNEALEKEKAAREEAEHMCQSLQTTIDKLEQYLKTRNTTEDQQIISHSNVNNISISQITRLQGELQIRDEQDEKFQKKAQIKETIKPRTVPVAAFVHTKDEPNPTCKSPKFRDFQDNEIEF